MNIYVILALSVGLGLVSGLILIGRKNDNEEYSGMISIRHVIEIIVFSYLIIALGFWSMNVFSWYGLLITGGTFLIFWAVY